MTVFEVLNILLRNVIPFFYQGCLKLMYCLWLNHSCPYPAVQLIPKGLYHIQVRGVSWPLWVKGGDVVCIHKVS